MESTNLIGALAIFTLVAVLILCIGHVRAFLRNPKNRFHFANVLAGGEGASTAAARDDPSVPDVPLKTRLDRSIASSHPYDPSHLENQEQREARFNADRLGRERAA